MIGIEKKILKYGSYLFICLPKLKSSIGCFSIFKIRRLGWVGSKSPLIMSFYNSMISKDTILITVGVEV